MRRPTTTWPPLCGAWGTFVEPRRLRLERAELAPRGDPQPAIRIGILADLQTDLLESEHESRAIDLLMSEQPDLILFAGDLIQAEASDVPRVLSRVRALLASEGKHEIQDFLECGRVEQHRRDVLEDDPLLGKVPDVADQALGEEFHGCS